MTSIELVLELIRLRDEDDDLSEIDCPACRGALLMIHQPDEALPDRLIGTCGSCAAWFLIDTAAGLMVRLPGQDTLRDR